MSDPFLGGLVLVTCVTVVRIDEDIGIDEDLAVDQVWPEAGQQRCWNHKIINVLNDLPKHAQGKARALLTQIPYAETQEEAEARRDTFVARYRDRYPAAVETLERDWERMVTFNMSPDARHMMAESGLLENAVSEQAAGQRCGASSGGGGAGGYATYVVMKGWHEVDPKGGLRHLFS